MIFSFLTVNYFVKPACIDVSHCWRVSPHALPWASGRRIGAEQMFPTRLVQKPSSVPTLLPPRHSFGCQDNLPVQYFRMQSSQTVAIQQSPEKASSGSLLLLLPHILRVLCLGALKKGPGWREVSTTRSAHAPISTTVQDNISHSAKCACVTMEQTPPRRMFFDRWIPAVPSRCVNQAVTSRAKIITVRRRQVNWHEQYEKVDYRFCLSQQLENTIQSLQYNVKINYWYYHLYILVFQ
jgi:hypothetical protein